MGQFAPPLADTSGLADWRKQAVNWLQEELAARHRQAAGGTATWPSGP
jgi:hypothetical protein